MDVSGLVKQFTQASHMMKQMAGLKGKDKMKFAQQMAQMGEGGRYKVKQRSKRLTKKERAKKKKGKKR